MHCCGIVRREGVSSLHFPLVNKKVNETIEINNPPPTEPRFKYHKGAPAEYLGRCVWGVHFTSWQCMGLQAADLFFACAAHNFG